MRARVNVATDVVQYHISHRELQPALRRVADIEQISHNAIALVVQLAVFDLSTARFPEPAQI